MIQRQTRRLVPLLVALAFGAAMGCKGGAPRTERDPIPKDPDLATPDPPEPPSSVMGTRPLPPVKPAVLQPVTGKRQGDVTLIAPGSEPRRVRRYRLGPSAKDTIAVSLASQSRIAIRGQMNRTLKFPTVGQVIGLQTRKRKTGLTHAFRFVRFGLKASGKDPSPAVNQALGRQMQQVQNVTGTFEITPAGRITAFAHHLPKGGKGAGRHPVLGELLRITEKLIIPWPDAAIGKGAKWKVVRQVTERGIEVADETTYALLASDARGDTVEVGISGGLPAGRRPTIRARGRTIQIQSLRRHGKLRCRVTAARLTARCSGDLTVNSITASTRSGQTRVMTLEATHRIVAKKPER